MATLTSRTLAQSTAITPTTLIHIVTTADTSQSVDGSSYKAELNQIAETVGGYQYYTAITVSSSEMLSIGTTPKSLLPAPGANKYYDFKAHIEYNYGTSAYTTSSVVLKLSTINMGFTFNINGVTQNKIQTVVSESQGGGVNLNSELNLGNQNGIDPTGGNGTIKVKIFYNIVNFG
jgi:hypothetical protein